VEGTNGKTNGHVHRDSSGIKAPPRVIEDLADACVRFVERALGFKLDFTEETLPVLDHYIREARGAAREKPETIPLVAQAAGSYLGEVIRRKYQGYWRLEEETEPRSFRVELEPVYLVLRPIELATRALELVVAPAQEASKTEARESDEDGEDTEHEDDEDARTATAASLVTDPKEDVATPILELDEDDRATVADRLAALGAVAVTDYFAPSTYLEVVEVIVAALREKRLAAGMEPDAHLEPDDYS